MGQAERDFRHSTIYARHYKSADRWSFVRGIIRPLPEWRHSLSLIQSERVSAKPTKIHGLDASKPSCGGTGGQSTSNKDLRAASLHLEDLNEENKCTMYAIFCLWH